MTTPRLAAAAATVLTTGALVGAAPLATAATATAPTAPARSTAAQYRLESVAPPRLPDGTATSRVASFAVGISDAGLVAGAAGDEWPARPFTGGRRSVWLGTDLRVDGAERTAEVSAVSPTGVVAGRTRPSSNGVVRWDGTRPVAVGGAPEVMPYTVEDVNAAGTMIGCAVHYKVGWFELWGPGGHLATPTMDRPGNCVNALIARDGTGVGTLNNPSFKNDGVYPNAMLITRAQVSRLPMPTPTTKSTADAMSPDGRLIVGRVGDGDGEPTTVMRLYRDRAPSPLRGAAGLIARDANDTGTVVGNRAGHAVTWTNGRTTDLDTQVRLPRGWKLTDAIAINARGDIAANALDTHTNRTIAVKLTHLH